MEPLLPENPDAIKYTAQEWEFNESVWNRVMDIVHKEAQAAMETRTALHFFLQFLLLHILPDEAKAEKPEWLMGIIGNKVNGKVWPARPVPEEFRRSRALMAYLSRRPGAPRPGLVKNPGFFERLKREALLIAGAAGYGPMQEEGKATLKRELGLPLTPEEKDLAAAAQLVLAKPLDAGSVLQSSIETAAKEEEEEEEEESEEEEDRERIQLQSLVGSLPEDFMMPTPMPMTEHDSECDCDGCMNAVDEEVTLADFHLSYDGFDVSEVSGPGVDHIERELGTMRLSEMLAVVSQSASRKLGYPVFAVLERKVGMPAVTGGVQPTRVSYVPSALVSRITGLPHQLAYGAPATASGRNVTIPPGNAALQRHGSAGSPAVLVHSSLTRGSSTEMGPVQRAEIAEEFNVGSPGPVPPPTFTGGFVRRSTYPTPPIINAPWSPLPIPPVGGATVIGEARRRGALPGPPSYGPITPVIPLPGTPPTIGVYSPAGLGSAASGVAAAAVADATVQFFGGLKKLLKKAKKVGKPLLSKALMGAGPWGMLAGAALQGGAVPGFGGKKKKKKGGAKKPKGLARFAKLAREITSPSSEEKEEQEQLLSTQLVAPEPEVEEEEEELSEEEEED